MALIEGRYFKGDMTDKRFEADGLAAYCRRFLSSGVWELGDNLKVSAGDGMKINIGYGYALIGGYLFGVVDNGTGPMQLTVENTDSQPRIDRVVGIADTNAQRVYTYIKKGIPTANPEAPALSSGEISLARINIAAGSTEILSSDIADERGDNTVCGVVNICDSIIAQVKTKIFEIGDIFISDNPNSPAIRFGGVWTRIKKRFIFGAEDMGDTAGNPYTAGKTGGSLDHAITVNEMPSHRHRQTFSGAISNSGPFGYATDQAARAFFNDGSVIYTNYEGGGAAFSILNSFEAAYIWKRTA